MSNRDAALAKGFFLFVVLLLFAIGLTAYSQSRTTQPARAQNVQLSPAALLAAEPVTGEPVVGTPAPAPAHAQESEADSSKANQKLVLRITPSVNGLTSYAFSITDFSGNNARALFTKSLGAASTMSIPFNAWDPTDTYIFIEEKDGGVPNYYVFKASGEPFADGNTFIDAGAVWTAKNIGFSIRDATGWASGTLLIIYTTKPDGTKGPPYWFEIPSTATIQLAG